MRCIRLLALISLFGFRSPEHAIYISTVEINCNSTTNLSKIVVKVFTDDMQDAIRNYNPDFSPSSADDVVLMNKALIASYFSDYLSIVVNDEPMELKFVDGEKENDTHVLRFTSKFPRKWEKLEIKGAYFSEVFPDQSNVFTINYESRKYYTRLTKSKARIFFHF